MPARGRIIALILMLACSGCGISVLEVALIAVGAGAAAAGGGGGGGGGDTTKYPPAAVTNPSPSNGAADVPLSVLLSWTQPANASYYLVHFGTASTPPMVDNVTIGSWDPGGLAAWTTYYWSVTACNADGQTPSSEWTFRTLRMPPGLATNPSPADAADNVSVTTGLSWTAPADADGYLVYFGTAASPPFMENTTLTTSNPPMLDNDTTYYWKVMPYNTAGNTTDTVVTWSFQTELTPVVTPPNAATNPIPPDGAENVSITATLSWTAPSGAEGYLVYFGTAASPPFVLDCSATAYDPGGLGYDTTYYWEVIPYNTGGNTADTVVTWSFSTESAPDNSIIVNSIGMKLKFISAGTYIMGSPDNDSDAEANEKPQHTINITKDFYIGVYEVTQAEWFAVMGTTPGTFTGDNNPVETVSWETVYNFILALNGMEGVTYRLPTEAEWEYACRAGTNTIYSYGDNAADLENYAAYKDHPGGSTLAVGQRLPNAWGLYDMHGNVWEWCEDQYDSTFYQYCVDNTITDDPCKKPYTNFFRVIRGGSWDSDPEDLRSGERDNRSKLVSDSIIGFRVVREIP